VDGHEKLGEKALRMGLGIGINTYGACDHVGKVLHLVVVLNSCLSDTIGHVFLDMVSAYQGVFVLYLVLLVNDLSTHSNFGSKLPLMEAVNWGGFPLFKQH
jgi:hypothetical protein